MTHTGMNMDPTMQQAIENATACANICLESINHCTHMGGKHAAPVHLGLLIDCAKICEMSADYMLRESMFHGEVCGLCADVCDECAMSCDEFQDDIQMKECAKK